MNIILSVNTSERNKIGKTLTDPTTFTGSLRENTSITTPDILMEINDPTGFNYAEIPDFNRKYFITDMVSIRTDLWRISMTVDVLDTYADAIKACSAIISNTEDVGRDNYLTSEIWKNKSKELTDILPFSSGLLSTGEFILITAGG